MKIIIAMSAAVIATSAIAQNNAPPLDLQLPASSPTSPPEASDAAAGGADSPGAYYGDTSGATDSAAAVNKGGAPDDNGTHASGAFSTGVGYSKGFGTGFSNAAELNVEKHTDDGHTYRLQINVEHSNGFPGSYDSRYRNIGPGYYGY